jgi:hypothetical protein
LIKQHPQTSKPAGESLTPRLGQERLSQDFPTPFNTRGNLTQISPASSDSEETSFTALQWAYKGHTTTNMPPASSDNIETRFDALEWGYEANTAINIPPESSDSEETRFNALQ